MLRSIVLDCGLTEELKWSVPCYTVEGRNVLIINAFINDFVISLLKVVLLKDPVGILEKPGDNSQTIRFAQFTDVNQIVEKEMV